MKQLTNKSKFTGNGFVFGAMAGILIGALIHPFGAGPGMVTGMAIGTVVELILWAQNRHGANRNAQDPEPVNAE